MPDRRIPEGVLERERRQMQQILELDSEELLVEEVDEPEDDDEDDIDADLDIDPILSGPGDGGAGSAGGFTYDTSLASLHSYLGKVDDTHGKRAFLDGGAIMTLPMFYLEGVVLFPGSTLPLRVIQPRFIAAVEKALNQVDAPCTIGVLRVSRHPPIQNLCLSLVGTTAEIRKYQRLDNGHLNVIARGQQRFHCKRCWVDADEVPYGQVQIVQEDSPLRAPRDVFGQGPYIKGIHGDELSLTSSSGASSANTVHLDSDNESVSSGSIRSNYLADLVGRPNSDFSSTRSPVKYDMLSNPCSSDEEQHGWARCAVSYTRHGSGEVTKPSIEDSFSARKVDNKQRTTNIRSLRKSKPQFNASMSFWPSWVWEMYDAYSLAQVAADMWSQIVSIPSLDDFVRKPDLLSFHIASKLPLSESARQELLEIDGVSYRLQREIQLLKAFNLIKCRNCQTTIAKRSEVIAMSSDGLLNAYVNPHGFVHEVITVYNAAGLLLDGFPTKEHSWFPGYAWTIANCRICKSSMGWLFTATKKGLSPQSFYGIRSSQIMDDACAPCMSLTTFSISPS